MANLVDSYSESNQSSSNIYSSSSSGNQLGQGFTGDGNVLQKAQAYLKLQGSATGTVVAHIYDHTGTFGTDGKPTGSALASSASFDVSTLTTSFQLIDFIFTGANKITLANGTKYFVTFEFLVTSAAPNSVLIGTDNTSPSHAGNLAYFQSGSWSADNTRDLIFYVYSDASSPSASASPSLSPSSSASPSISPSASRSPSASLSPSASSSPSGSPSLSPSSSLSPSASLSPSISPSSSLSPSSSYSPSASQSPSASLSPSASRSPSASVSPSPSASPSASPSPLPPRGSYLRIAKSGVNAITNSDPEKMIFDSQYGTLKYFTKQQVNISFDASTLDISAQGSYSHNLGYYPYCEVFVRVYVGSTPSGNYEYCPFAGAGATILYSANVKITTSQIVVYGMIDGVSSSVWHFDFLIFVYKNDLQLS